jgi:PBSX family phage terminase large subunit
MSSLSKTEIRNELWRRGILEFKMHSLQKEMFSIYRKAEPRSTLVWLLARQSGKSYLLAITALVEAIQNPNSIIKLLTDTKLHVQTIFEPLFREILEDCPEDVKPEYLPSKFIYVFPNGSQIQMAGTDANNAERLRGQKSTCILVDEAAFCNKLNYNVMSVLYPTTTHTGGKIILASTPPEEPDHDFVTFIENAENEGFLTKKTLYDNPLLSNETKASIEAKFPGGANNPQFKREYLCELIRDENKTVIPEFDEALASIIVREYNKPPFYTPYVSMDLGFKDLTVVLFGYYDFKQDKVVIEDEIVKKGVDLKLDKFSDEILKKEEILWMNILTNEQINPEVRVSDIDYIVINEINRASMNRLNFQAIKKSPGYKLPLINQLRVMLQSEKVIIHPRCETLISHLKNGRWKDSSAKDDFARSPGLGHYDAIDALLYLIKSVNYTKNPYPVNYGRSGDSTFYNNGQFGYKSNQKSSNITVYESIFGVNKRK